MRKPGIAFMSACGLVVLLGLRQLQVISPRTSQAEEPPVAQSDAGGQRPDRKVIAIPADAPKRQEDILPLMHAKVGHSQKVFEGLVTRDFDRIEAGAKALMQTSLATPDVEADGARSDEVFEHLKLEFVRLAARLKQTAANENLEGAAYITEKLNATCISCHQYLRDKETQTTLE
jgi:cytochrome c556